jgi:hypothetical protein
MAVGEKLPQPPGRGRNRVGRGDAESVETFGAGVCGQPAFLLGRIGQKSRLA